MPAPPPTGLPDLLLQRCQQAPDALLWAVPERGALGVGRRLPGGWWGATVAETAALVVGLSGELARRGVGPGAVVGIAGPTHPMWAALDLAVQLRGAVAVGLPVGAVADAATRAGCELVVGQLDHPDVLELPASPGDGCALADLVAAVDATRDAVGVVSDTGVYRFAGHHLHAAVTSSAPAFPTQPADRALLFAPLADVTARFATWSGLVAGSSGWYVPRVDALAQRLVQAQPHVILAVPEMVAEVRARAIAEARERGAQRLLSWAVSVGATVRAKASLGLRDRATLQLADRLVHSRVRRGLGGRVRVVVVGGGELDADDHRFLSAAGLRVCTTWGTAAAGGPVKVDGVCLPGVAVQTHPQGVRLRGPATGGHWVDA